MIDSGHGNFNFEGMGSVALIRQRGQPCVYLIK